jgi:hypothetical protein
MYAHATHWWDVEAEQWVEMPVVDQSKAMVFHVPAGLAECRVYEVDIVAGWEAVTHAMWERAWRRRKDLYETLICISVGDGRDAHGTAEPTKSESGDRGGFAAVPAPGSAKAPNESAQPEPVSGVEASKVPDVGSEGEPGASGSVSGVEASTTPVPGSTSDRAVGANGEGGDQASTGVVAPKGEEAVAIPAVEPPAPDVSPSPNMPDEWRALAADELPEHGVILGHWDTAFDWARDRVNAIKVYEVDGEHKARRRLSGLWSLNPEIPTFPKGGPSTPEELDKVIAWCDLVEMEFGMPFGPTDPRPKDDKPSISQRRRDAIEQATEAEGKAMGKAQRARKTRKTEEAK